ncbi:MAG TPA: S8 family serine peptidase [Longimicrobium sp.]
MGSRHSARYRRSTLSALAAAAVLAAAACARDAGTPVEPGGPAAARAAADQGAPFYYHQGEPVYLKADPERLVVASDLPPAAADAAVRAALTPAGVRLAALQELPNVPGHRLVRLAGADHAAAAAAVARLRADGRFRFASTAFRTVAGNADVLLVDRVIVRFRDGVSPEQVRGLAASLGMRVVREPNPGRGELDHWLAYPAGADPLRLAAELDRHPLVEWADPDKLSDRRPQYVPTDPYYGWQYYLKNTAFLNGARVDDYAEEAWNLSLGTSTVKVAVIDDGVDRDNLDLAINGGQEFDTFWPNVTQGENGFNPRPADSHGTHVAGIINMIHNNSLGGAGIAPGVQLNAVRIFRDGVANTDARIADGLNWAWQAVVSDVLSNSWGGGAPSNAITAAVNNATTQGRGGKGAIVVFSGGNTSDRDWGIIGGLLYPSTLASAIAVGAINRNGALTNYSPEGPELDIVAPSGHYTGHCIGDVLTTDLWGADGCNDGPNGDINFTTTFSGTSAAAPQVSAAAALLFSREPNLTYAQARDRILNNTDPWGAASQYGRGKLNAYKILSPPVIVNPLTVTIGGPSSVLPNRTCYWWASASGGTPGYTYNWYRNSTWVGSGEDLYVNTGSSSFTLKVVVTDAAGATAQATKSVTVSSTARICPV